MAEETKKTTVKKTSTAKAAAPKAEIVEAPKAEAPKAEKKVAKKGNGNKVSAIQPRLKLKYENEVRKALLEKYNYSLEEAVSELTQITGQKPIITKAKKSIASFKLREGQEIGCKVTLRGVRMWDFYDKLVSIALPRVRDFRGVSKNAFDGRGNYTLGIKEQLIFPEIDYDKVQKVRGMDIVIVTTARTDEEAFTLLDLMGMPFHR